MNHKIRWGILSTARIAEDAMVPAIQASKNGEVVAVASRDMGKAKAFAKRLGLPKAYGCYEDLLADPMVDAIYNPLPTSLHSPWSIKAAEAGKPVLCEKPLALNADEAEEMIQVFAERTLLLSEALMYRYHPLTRKVKALIHEGAIGRLVTLRSQFNAPIAGGDIRRSKEAGGGALLDLGCYCVSVQRYLAGEEPSAVSAVAVFEEEVDVSLSAALCFPSGVTGHLGCSMNAVFDCSYEAVGSTGRLLVDRGAMCAWPGEAFKIKYWHDEKFEEIDVAPANHYQRLVEDFGEALILKKPMDLSLVDSLGNMKILDRALKAALAM